MKKFTIIFTLSLILTAFTVNLNAQYTGGVGSTWNNPVSAMLSQKMWGDINGKMLLLPALRKLGCTQAQMNKMNLSQAQIALAKKTCTPGTGTTQNTQTSGRTTNSAPITPPASVYSTTFKPTGTHIALPEIVAEITPNDRALQQRQIAFLEAEISRYEQNQQSRGYGNDVAAAMAFFAAVSIQLQNPNETVSPQAVDSLTDALRETFGNKLANISDRDKQQLYESLLTIGMFIAGRAENADAKTLAALKELSASSCDQYLKLDVTKYRFDDNGLVEIKSGTNAPTTSGKEIAPPSVGKIDSKLIGSWRATSAEHYIFHANGRFSHFSGSHQSQTEGKYTVSNGKVYFSNIVYEKGKTMETPFPDAIFEYELGKDNQGEYLKIAKSPFGITYADISAGFKFRKSK